MAEIPVYDNGKVVEHIPESDVDWLPGATHGGAWIGQEKASWLGIIPEGKDTGLHGRQ